MKYSIPGTAREIVECLTTNQGYTVKQLASMLGVTPNTIYRIRKGYCIQPKIHLNLIQLYLTLQQQKAVIE